jgi:hypothetical protein
MKTISPDTQKMLDVLKSVATKTLERKRRLGEYAVVWQDNKPVIIGVMLEDSDDDFRRETSLLTDDLSNR